MMTSGVSKRRLFEMWAASYDRCSLRPLHAATHRSVLGAVLALCGTGALAEVSRVLDVGCGTGHLLRVLATLFPRALCVGVDPASTMLEQAGHLTNAMLVQGDVERLPFADASFDVVTATLSVRHWADRQAGLDEIGRVLAPGGVFGLADALPVDRHTIMRRMARLPRSLPLPMAAALRHAGLRPATVSMADGFGPVPEIALVVCRKMIRGRVRV